MHHRIFALDPGGFQPDEGLIQECLVRPGDRVKGGQVLGRFFNQDALAELESRTVALEGSETAIHQGEATLEVERTKLRRVEALYNRKAVSIQDLELQQLAVKTAELGLQAAIRGRRMAEAQLHAAKAMVAAREIVSPHDGIIVEVYKRAGESAMLNIPIYKVVAIDRMRVTGYLDVGDAWRVRRGRAVRITPELEGGDLPIEREVFGVRSPSSTARSTRRPGPAGSSPRWRTAAACSAPGWNASWRSI